MGAHGDAIGAAHLFIKSLEGKAAFFEFGKLLRVGLDVGIDEDEKVVLLVGDVDDHDALEAAHLIGREPTPGAAYMVSAMSAASLRSSSLNSVTGSAWQPERDRDIG